MLDPAVYAAMVLVVAYGLKLLAEAVGFVLDEATYNALAAAIVTALVAWLGGNVVKAGLLKVKPDLESRGLIKRP